MSAPAARRPTGALLVAVVGLIGVGGLVSAVWGASSQRSGSAIEELRRGLAAPDQEPFAFTFASSGTKVLDCFMPNRRFHASVYPARHAVVFHAPTAAAPPSVVVTDQAVLINRSLLETPPFATTWLRANRPVDSASRAALRTALGADLGRYALSDGQPPSGSTLVAAVLGVAAKVDRIGESRVDGSRADGYRILVDPRRFRAAAPLDASPEDGQTIAADVIPRFDVWLRSSDSRVARLTVTTEGASGKPGPPELGWEIVFTDLSAVDVPGPPADSGVTDIRAVDGGRLSPVRRDCRLSP